MKEIRNAMALVPLALWVIVTLCALPSFGVESEMAAAEGLSTARTAQLEWLALAFSSGCALLMQVFRLRK